MLICPKCGEPLSRVDKIYKCKNNHNYDIAKNGYVNLLLANMHNSKNPGDNKEMMLSRTGFLNRGYYEILLNAIIDTISKHSKEYINMLDVGCGEGYYTRNIAENFNGLCVGLDISKVGLDIASKFDKKTKYAVASAFTLPIADESVDILINIFAPSCKSEFHRVLKPTGYFIKVIPDVEHLIDLKNIVYDKPYKNEVEGPSLEGFELVEETKVNSQIDIDNNRDILALFQMTPYYYKTRQEDRDKLLKVNELNTHIAFLIRTYKKI